MDVLLGCCVKHWESNDTDNCKYEQSRPVKRLSKFLSHDWHTPRLRKFFALCFVFNLTPACLMASGTSLVLAACHMYWPHFWGRKENRLGVETHQSKLQIPIWAHAVFWCVLIWGQHLRQLLLGRYCREYVFFDKLCVDQSSPEKKKGIFGIPGFLNNSEKLVMLLSPHYFTRLWCTFELATSTFFLYAAYPGSGIEWNTSWSASSPSRSRCTSDSDTFSLKRGIILS